GGLFQSLITQSDKELAFGVAFTVEDGTFKTTGGNWKIGEFELGHMVTIDELGGSFGVEQGNVSIDVDAGASFKAVKGRGITLGGTYE
ncbi:hypothetical protein, partial [Enterococcus casseliflavus]|uniref:hypothetical protein n=1 Tax=Enterococcus casseliflavus TaxID=37734 RepID=UPI003D0A70F9